VQESAAVLGVAIDRVTAAEAFARVEGFVRDGRPRQIATVNLDFLRLAQHDQRFRDTLANADLVLADGMPVVWLSRLAGTPLPERVTGVDLLDGCAALAAARGYRIFLLGAAPGVAADAAAALEKRHPGLEIAGALTPPMGPFSAETDASLLAAVRAAQPQLLFVALGAPRQDLWLHDHLAELAVPVCVGVGGAFDILSGRLNRAPRWMQRAGLEWLFRLAQEPSRLWRRYLLGDLPLLARALGGRVLHANNAR
jgi:N-acetylglucosaminyldiphosphoundecaprenol N-acetyl-beta-D-mannosaminyltransferase